VRVRVVVRQSESFGTHPLLLGALEDDDAEAGDPAVYLARPVVERRLGDDDEVRAVRAADELEVAEERDRLERLAETLRASRHYRVSLCSSGYAVRGRRETGTHHLVGENAVDAVVVEPAHPVEALDLVLAHLAALDIGRRLGEDERALALAEPVRLLLGLEQLGVLVLLRLAAARLGRLAAPAGGRRRE